MLGADRHQGWFSHFERMKQWETRATIALEDLPHTDFHEALDYSLAYFVWCHSLREWIIKDKAMSLSTVEDALKVYPEWKIVRDLANRSRHLVITQKPTDAEWSVFREYDPFAPTIEGRERVYVNLFFNSRKYRLVELVGKAGRMWDRVLADAGLLVSRAR